jgi:hypothetical protein
MAKCGFCGTTIIFGGVKANGLTFCNQECCQKGKILIVSHQMPDTLINEEAMKIHQGLCPKCRGHGPVDVHTSYRVYSALVVTSWKNIQNICCRSCGRKSQLENAAFSLLFGWWGFPWGLIMTPIQVGRNIASMVKSKDELNPSAQLENIVRTTMASHIASNKEKEELKMLGI